jgi:hypothetical protein
MFSRIRRQSGIAIFERWANELGVTDSSPPAPSPDAIPIDYVDDVLGGGVVSSGPRLN